MFDLTFLNPRDMVGLKQLLNCFTLFNLASFVDGSIGMKKMFIIEVIFEDFWS